MKQTILLGLFLFITSSSYSQFITKNIAFELRYPIPVGDNFINKAFDDGYLGFFDIGMEYDVFKHNGLGLGVFFNTSMLRLSVTEMTLIIISPKIKINYEIDLKKIIIVPQIGMGYSNWRFSGSTNVNEFNPQGDKYKHNVHGLTFRGSSKFILNSENRLKMYFNLCYEFTKLDKKDELIGDNKYSRNIKIFYPGIGLIWNFGK